MPAPLTKAQREKFDSGEAPPAHLDMLGAVSFRAVAAASRLGLFGALVDAPLTADELASRLDLDAPAVTLLLDSLLAHGYLVDTNGGPDRTSEAGRADRRVAYGLSEGSRRWLVPGAGFDAVAEFWSALLESQWQNLEDTIRTGTPAADGFYGWLEDHPRQRAQFQGMLAGIAESLAPATTEAIGPFSGHLLDIGGGHGVYTAALLRSNPDAVATILDFPGALESARATCREAGVAERVSFVPASATEHWSELADGSFDLALLFSVVHGLDHASAQALLRQTHRVLRPGGRLALLEQLASGPPADPLGAAFVTLFSLNLFHTQGGRAPHESDLRSWLDLAGFNTPEARPLRQAASEWIFLTSK